MPDDGTVTLLKTGEARGSADGSRLNALYYDILADGNRVGTCELRPETTWASRLSGQAAYTVFPPYRGHRYALQALRKLCEEARALSMDGLTVTCRPENGASRRILELAGAEFEGISPVPPEHPLYSSGVREICIYVVDIARQKADPRTEAKREE